MPYVRTHGNQIAIVHGEREKESGNVQQRSLFTLYSKKEAAAAVGDGDPRDSTYFQRLVEEANPQLRFNWKQLNKEIRLRINILPDIYPLREAHGERSFDASLCEFVRQLVISDPLNSKVGRETLKQHQAELSTLQKIISLLQEEMNLCVERDPSPFDLDDAFSWRYELQSHQMPIGMEEFAEGLYREGNYVEAKSLFSLLTRCFPQYAEGYNYLGLIALNENEPKEAVAYFRDTIKFGRNLFARKVAKSDYWSDLKTRPYMRGLMNLALALNASGQFKETLRVCDQLIDECGRSHEDSGWAHKAAAYLNLEDWENAIEKALKLAKVAPDEGFILGYALFEIGRYQDCLGWFLHASLNSPHSAHLLTDKSKARPKTTLEVEDHNGGIMMLRSLPRFFQLQSKASRKFFRKFIENEQVQELLSEVVACNQTHFERKADTDRKYFDRWHELQDLAFARKQAGILLQELRAAKALSSSKMATKST